jgi:hypothetical protein
MGFEVARYFSHHRLSLKKGDHQKKQYAIVLKNGDHQRKQFEVGREKRQPKKSYLKSA